MAIAPGTAAMSSDRWIFHNAARFYILAYQLVDADCKDLVIDLVMKCAHMHCSIPGRGVILTVWKSTPLGAPIRRLVVDYWIYGTSGSEFVGDEEKFPEEFKDELVAGFYARGAVGSRGRMPGWEDRLEYHH